MGKIVFLDTNVFVGNNFSFLNKPLTKLKKYVENNVVIMLENEITKKDFDHMVETLDGYYYENAILKKEKPQKASQNKIAKCEI